MYGHETRNQRIERINKKYEIKEQRLSYKEAVKKLKQGALIKRKHWSGFWRMEEACLNPTADSHVWQEWFEAIVEYGRIGQGYDGRPALPTHQDTKAHDWMVIKIKR